MPADMRDVFCNDISSSDEILEKLRSMMNEIETQFQNTVEQIQEYCYDEISDLLVDYLKSDIHSEEIDKTIDDIEKLLESDSKDEDESHLIASNLYKLHYWTTKEFYDEKLLELIDSMLEHALSNIDSFRETAIFMYNLKFKKTKYYLIPYDLSEMTLGDFIDLQSVMIYYKKILKDMNDNQECKKISKYISGATLYFK